MRGREKGERELAQKWGRREGRKERLEGAERGTQRARVTWEQGSRSKRRQYERGERMGAEAAVREYGGEGREEGRAGRREEQGGRKIREEGRAERRGDLENGKG